MVPLSALTACHLFSKRRCLTRFWQKGEPAWWLNLQARPDTIVDLPGGSRAVRARAGNENERPRLWAILATYDKDLDGYAARRSRETAVVILSARPE